MTDALARLRATLSELVAFDTTSTRSNLPMVEYLQARLKKAGFDCERQLYRDDAGVEKANLVAVKGARAGVRPELALVAHTDCVPFDAAWTQALELTEREGKLYGRGACDTKAQVATSLLAGEAADASALAKPLLLIFTADEEVGCVGAKRLVDAKLGGARYAIVGEPTSLTPVRANKGYFLAEVEVRGKEGHSAYPKSGASAIFRAARLLERMERLQSKLEAVGDPIFEPPYTTLNVGVIQGGKAKNVIAGSCRFTLEWRPVPGLPTDEVPKGVEDIIQGLQREEPGYDATLKPLRGDAGVATPESSAIVRFLAESTGNKPATVAFGTEAPQMTQLGAEAVVFGAGDIRVAHQTGEFVPVTELVTAHALLEQAISKFCG
jgi:acetylornithine deacetylase